MSRVEEDVIMSSSRAFHGQVSQKEGNFLKISGDIIKKGEFPKIIKTAEIIKFDAC